MNTKVEKGTLYFTEEGFFGKLIEPEELLKAGVSNINKMSLTNKEQKELLSYLSEDYKISHLCISFYRDAIIIGENTYNICLSCGDFWKNDEKFYLDNNSLDKLKTLLDNLKAPKNDLIESGKKSKIFKVSTEEKEMLDKFINRTKI